MEMTSTAFAPMGEIPRRHTCEGDDVAPPLSWRGVPGAARSLVFEGSRRSKPTIPSGERAPRS